MTASLKKATEYPRPIQCLGFRSTLGDQDHNAAYNIAFWENGKPFKSSYPVPGVVSMIPLSRKMKRFVMNREMLTALIPGFEGLISPSTSDPSFMEGKIEMKRRKRLQ